MGFWDALFKTTGDDAAQAVKRVATGALGGAAGGAAKFYTEEELRQRSMRGPSIQQTPQSAPTPISGEYTLSGEVGVWRDFSDGYRRRVR
jgi:hypothetical protein